VPDDPRREFPSPARENDVPAGPFPREAYVFGWLVICVVAAEGIYSLVTGVLGTGIILICLIPVMVWLMHIRPRRHAETKGQEGR
jgi:hypothetical protein